MGLASQLVLLIIGFCFTIACSHQSTKLQGEKLQGAEFRNLNLGESEQLVWVHPPTQGFVTQVQLLEKQKDGWVMKGDTFEAVVGESGMTPSSQKVEGDRKTPEGLFTLTKVYGKFDNYETRMPYTKLSSEDKWVDDPSSPVYNQFIRGPASAKSYEQLLRSDQLYDLLLVIDYNRFPVRPGKGSAIFMHLWNGPVEGTAGCVALAGNHLATIVNWLDPAKKPQILLGPVPTEAAIR